MKTITFTVEGTPVPKARARVVNGRAYTPKKTVQFEKAVAAKAFEAVYNARWEKGKGAEYEVSIVVYRKDKRGDIDNYAKAVLDGCNGVVWADDMQVDLLTIARGQYIENEYTWVSIVEVKRPEVPRSKLTKKVVEI